MLKYRVIGRYMKGTEVTAYQFMRSDGVQERIKRDKVIWLISNNMVENMRIQNRGNNDIIIRGKGINLNELKIYDENKNMMRGEQKEEVGSTKVNIVKRILSSGKCVGYVIKLKNGEEKQISKNEAFNMAHRNEIGNAKIRKVERGGKEYIALEGVGCTLDKLGVIYAGGDITARALFIKEGCTLIDRLEHKMMKVRANSYVVYTEEAKIRVYDSQRMKDEYIPVKSNSANCDEYTDNISRYVIRTISNNDITITKEILLRWNVVKKVAK